MNFQPEPAHPHCQPGGDFKSTEVRAVLQLSRLVWQQSGFASTELSA